MSGHEFGCLVDDYNYGKKNKQMSDNKTAKLVSAGSIETQGAWFKRTVSLEGQPDRLLWHKNKAVLDSLDQFVGQEMVFYIRGNDGKNVGFSLNEEKTAIVRAPTDNWPFAQELMEGQGARPGTKDGYWEAKDAREAAQFEYMRNERDPRIALQHLQSLCAPFYLATLGDNPTVKTVESRLDALMKKAKELYDESVRREESGERVEGGTEQESDI